jgi:hypothetical protein
VKRSLLSIFAAAGIAALPALACADPSGPLDVAGGYIHLSDGTSSGAAIVSLHGVGISGIPGVHPQLSVAAPLTSGGGRYAVTAEGVVHVPVTHVFAGAGVGVGQLNAPLRPGVLYDAFAGAALAPHVDVVARYYGGFSHSVGQGVFAGLSVHL